MLGCAAYRHDGDRTHICADDRNRKDHEALPSLGPASAQSVIEFSEVVRSKVAWTTMLCNFVLRQRRSRSTSTFL